MKKIIYHNLITLALISSFFHCSLFSKKDKPSHLSQEFEEIKELYFSSLQSDQKVKLKKKFGKRVAKGKISEDVAIKTLNNLFSKLSKKEMLDVGIKIFKNNDKSSFINSERIMDNVSFRDLSVFYGNPTYPENNFMKLTNKTQTIAGEISYLLLLYNPSSDIELLKKRQKAVKLLVNNESLYNKLMEVLKKLAEEEKFLLANFGKREKTIDSLLANQYVKEVIPSIPYVGQTFGSYLDSINSAIERLNNKLSSIINENYIWAELRRTFDLFINPLFVIKKYTSFLTEESVQFSLKRPLVTISAKKFGKVLRKAALFSMLSLFPSGTYQNLAFRVFLGLEALNEGARLYQGAKFNDKIRDAVNESVKNVKLFINNALRLKKLVDDEPDINEVLLKIDEDYKNGEKSVDELLNIFNSLIEEDGELEADETKITNISDVLSFLGVGKGKGLAEYMKLKKYKKDLSSLYRYAGEIDCLLSVATLYKNFSSNTAQYGYAHFIDAKKPFIKIDNMWSPFVGPDRSVLNDITLGENLKYDDIARINILTGPNAGGKSTSLSIVALNAFCAQTITISPGKMELTPFKKIITLLNIHDTPGKESLFQAHIRRTDQAFNDLKNINLNDPALIIPDELYNSTAENVATALAFGTYKVLAKDYPGVILFAASHFSKLSELSKDDEIGNLVKNWKIKEAEFDENGRPIWSYKVEPGINKQNIAIDIARQAISNEDVSSSADEAFKKLYEIGGLDPNSEISIQAQRELNRLKEKYKKIRVTQKELIRKKETKTRIYRELEEKHRKLIKKMKSLKKEAIERENELINCRNHMHILEQENYELKKKLNVE